MKKEEDPSPSVDYIVATMRNSLDDQTAHAKVFSSHRYEKQKMMKRMMTQSCQICTTWQYHQAILVARTCLGSFRSLITTW
jgi:hypothetical protein